MTDGDERGWKFELEDLEDDGDDSAAPERVERESVSAENAAFVTAGVLLTVGTVVVLAL